MSLDIAPDQRLFEGPDTEVTGSILLDDPNRAWGVTEGRFDLFSIPAGSGVDGGPRRYLLSVGPGEFVTAIPATDPHTVDMVAVPIGGTRVVEFTPDDYLTGTGAAADRNLRMAEQFATALGSAAAGLDSPRIRVGLGEGDDASVRAGDHTTTQDDLVWVVVRSGKLKVANDRSLVLSPASSPFPVAEGMWLTALEDSEVSALTRDEVAEQVDSREGVRSLAQFFGGFAAAVSADAGDAEVARYEARKEREVRSREVGLRDLAEVLGDVPHERVPPAEGDELLETLHVIGAEMGVQFQPAAEWETDAKRNDPLQAICRASRIRSRQIGLRGDWWSEDAGAFLGFLQGDDRTPVALIREPDAYHMVNVVDGTTRIVTPAVAAELEPLAFAFYQPLPDRPLSVGDLGAIAFDSIRREVGELLLIALAGAGIGLLVPWATNKMLGEVVPVGNQRTALVLMFALIAVQIGNAFFDASKAFILVRIEGRSNARLQSGIVDRLLSLPASFFRRFTVGDLAQRAGAIGAVRDLLSGAAATSLLSGVFALVFLGQLWYYSWRLSLVAIGIMILSIGTTAILVARSVKSQREQQTLAGRLSGFTVQLIGAIPKLRVAAAEDRAFSEWADRFRDQKEVALRGGANDVALQTFNTVLPLIASLGLFAYAGWMVAEAKEYALDPGTFVAFNAAFGTFFGAVVAFSNTMITTLAAIPMMERAMPILEAQPELSGDRTDPGELSGHIEASHITFRYKEDGPTILDDVSFVAKPGEFVAFVGPSGSGKSTTLRILLGFEEPEAGAVYYDGQILEDLDVTALRSQIGVVLQTSKLSQGDIFQNIVGSAPLTLEDAWAAAEAAGLDRDIETMPMQMHTVVSEGGSTLSGGQRQRLLIARALVRQPRIILFDEATSALDNRTQEQVSRSLEDTNATRIVIAHRLSTVRKADRIYVMVRGKVVQSGTYDELIAQPGVFADLASRQLS